VGEKVDRACRPIPSLPRLFCSLDTGTEAERSYSTGSVAKRVAWPRRRRRQSGLEQSDIEAEYATRGQHEGGDNEIQREAELVARLGVKMEMADVVGAEADLPPPSSSPQPAPPSSSPQSRSGIFPLLLLHRRPSSVPKLTHAAERKRKRVGMALQWRGGAQGGRDRATKRSKRAGMAARWRGGAVAWCVSRQRSGSGSE
jgi:hypothetical protein